MELLTYCYWSVCLPTCTFWYFNYSTKYGAEIAHISSLKRVTPQRKPNEIHRVWHSEWLSLKCIGKSKACYVSTKMNERQMLFPGLTHDTLSMKTKQNVFFIYFPESSSLFVFPHTLPSQSSRGASDPHSGTSSILKAPSWGV